MLKTLLIDDERPALKALEHLMRRYEDIEIKGTFIDTEQALIFLKNSETIDLVFLDIDMPKKNGIEVSKLLIAEQPNIEIIFVTAYGDFAVDAFEVNALDYIMKPVSPKRLDKTMARVRQKQQEKSKLLLWEKREKFLNKLLASKAIDNNQVTLAAKALGIDFTETFSFFVILLIDGNKQRLSQLTAPKHISLENICSKLSMNKQQVVWKTIYGICILDFGITGENCKQKELDKAKFLKKSFLVEFPDDIISVGIAERNVSLQNFTSHYLQARNSAGLGIYMMPGTGVYHFSDSCLLPLLDQYITQPNDTQLIHHTLGRILEYDAKNGTELFHTLEALLLNNNLQDVAHKLFVHYKTVQFRKQNIEKILGSSLHSFTCRTMLGIALTLFYLHNLFQKE